MLIFCIILGILFKESFQRGLHACYSFLKVDTLYHHDGHDNNIEGLSLVFKEK